MSRAPSPWWDPRLIRSRFALLLVAGVAAIAVGGVPWLGSWKMAIDWVAGAYVLIGPLSAGLVAWDASRMRTTKWDRVVCSTPGGVRGWLDPVAAVWATGVAVQLVLSVVVTAVTVALGGVVVPRQLAILFSGAAVYLLLVAIGCVVGTRLPGPWAPPLAVTLTFLLCFLSGTGHIPELFRTGGVTGLLVGQVYDLSTLGLYAVCATAAGVSLLGITLRVVSRWRPRLPTALVVGAALAVSTWHVAGDPERYLSVDVPLSCSDTAPEVCMAAEADRPLPAVSAELHRLIVPLVAVGATIPERWAERYGATPLPAGVGALMLSVDDDTGTAADVDSVILSVATPADCPEYSSMNIPQRAFAVRSLLCSWLLVRNGLRPASTNRFTRWASTPRSNSWVLDTYAQLRSCQLRNLRVPSY